MAILFAATRFRATDKANEPIAGAFLAFYSTLTSMFQPIYADSALSAVLPNPVQADANGLMPEIWLDDSLDPYKVVFSSPDINNISIPGSIIWTILQYNNIIPGEALAEAVGPFLNPLTAAEIAKNVTPVNYAYAAQTAIRYAPNTAPGVTPMDTAIQAAIDSASQSSAEVTITDLNGLSKPLLLRSGTQQNIAITGNGRVSTILLPLAADIHQSPQNINALIINQGDNDHLHLSRLRAFSSAYTGQFLYCKEGGCADGSGQTLFSAVIEDCWFSFGSSNSGIFDGGFNNLQAINLVFESTKTGCFILEGSVSAVSVNADLLFSNITMNGCFDSFIYANGDTTLKVLISVNGLHAYSHQRGQIISITKGIEMSFHDIILEPAIGNAGTTGLFQFTDCIDVVCSNFIAGTANSQPKCAIGINIINGFTGKFSDAKITATVGLQISGTGTLDLTVDNVDFIGCDTAFQMLSGTLGGVIYVRQCRLNNNQLYGLITLAGTATFDITLEDCEVLNCGLNGTATNRNMDITTSGTVTVVNCKIGQNNGGAAAADYIRANGAGTFTVRNPTFIGTPPTAVVDATSTQPVNFIYQGGAGGTIIAAATITLPSSGEVFQISGNTNITSVVATGCAGRRATLIFQGTPTFTDGSNLKLASNLVATADDTITIVSDGTSWYEVSRSVN